MMGDRNSNLLRIIIIAVVMIVVLLPSSSSNSSAQRTVADVKIQLITQMRQDGLLSERLAEEAAAKYVTEKDGLSQVLSSADLEHGTKQNTDEAIRTVSWKDYLSLINFLKVIGVILFLFAFSGVIRNITDGLWRFIVKVPLTYYQLIFITLTLTGTIFPHKLLPKQYFYLALFCSLANLMIVAWIIQTNYEAVKKLKQFIRRFSRHPIPIEILSSLFGLAYFVCLALIYQSAVFGFFAAVCLSGVFSFGLYYVPGVLAFYFKRDYLCVMVFGHLAVLGLYSFIHSKGYYRDSMQYFDAGIQYYCSIALGVALLCGSSPFARNQQERFYSLVFIVVFIFSTFAYFFLKMQVPASFMFIFFALFFIEWVGCLGFRSGVVVGSFSLGALIFAFAMFLERYSSLIIFSINSNL